jgi:choline monooxygenase
MTSFFIDPDIRRAETLPSEFYTRDDVFAAMKTAVFDRTWHWVGDVHTCVPPNLNVAPLTLLEGMVNEPLLLVRQSNGDIKCLSNVCTHRGNLLIGEACKARQLVCGYHGRRFELDGAFKSMPEFEAAIDFPRPCDSLCSFDLKSWGQQLFVSLDPAFDFSGVIDAMNERVGFLPLDKFEHDPTRDNEFTVEGHWALYCDNYLEGFHIPFVHADLNAEVDYDQYTTVLFEHASLQIAHAKGGSASFDLPPGHVDHGAQISAYYFWIFPNMMFNFYPWGLSINIVRPISKTRTKVSFVSYVYDSTKLDVGAGADLETVEHEDELVVASVQRGIQSKGYTTGRFSPKQEQGVHHFHRLLAEFLG